MVPLSKAEDDGIDFHRIDIFAPQSSARLTSLPLPAPMIRTFS
jgi:hypothetical protein